jgi:hypothetical protein
MKLIDILFIVNICIAVLLWLILLIYRRHLRKLNHGEILDHYSNIIKRNVTVVDILNRVSPVHRNIRLLKCASILSLLFIPVGMTLLFVPASSRSLIYLGLGLIIIGILFGLASIEVWGIFEDLYDRFSYST